MRVHLAMRDVSFIGGCGEGRVDSEVADAGADDGPAVTRERRFKSGDASRSTKRSWDGTEKKP